MASRARAERHRAAPQDGRTGHPGTAWPIRAQRAVAAAVVAATLLAGAGCRWLAAPRPLVISFGEDSVVLDPHLGNRNVGWSVLASICDPLVAFGPDLRLEPALAESWEQPDPTHWRFTLRRGVRFHNGATLTAEDVVASVTRARSHPKSAVSYHLVGVHAITAEGERTVSIETSAPIPDLLNRLTFVLVVPHDLAAARAITAPVGTGSYRFLRKERDNTVVVRAWAGWRGRPPIADVRFELCGSDEEAARRLVAGASDVCHRVPDDLLAELDAVATVRLVQQPGLAVQLLAVHPEFADGEARRALADPRVRRALLLALDRGAWLRRIFRGNGAVATQFVHPAVFGFDPSREPVPHDPAAARALLDEAGFGDGFDTTFSPGSASPDLAAAIVSDLARVGVRLRPATATAAAPLHYFAWACSTGDASDFLNMPLWHIHEDVPAPAASRLALARTAALAAAADRETDPARRLELLHEAQRLVLEELPLLPLTIRWGYRGVSDRVEVVTRHDDRELPASFRWRRQRPRERELD